MTKLQYLTVQDVLWINLQVTKRVGSFDYARLEEATFTQYAYGESTGLVPQAWRFLTGFLRLTPLEAGNEATALVGCFSFLRLNGMRFTLSDAEAADWFRRATNGGPAGSQALAEVVEPIPDFHPSLHPNVRAAVQPVLDAFPQTIAELTRVAAKT